MRRIGRLLEDCNPSSLRHDLLEQFEPLHRQFRGHNGEPGYVAARARQTCDQAAFQRVGRRSHDDRNALHCALRGADRSGAEDYDDIDLRPQQIADQRGYRFNIITIMAKLVGDVAPLDITEVAHPAHEFLAEWIVARGSRPDVPNTRRLARLLRARRERPCGYTAADKYDEFPPPHGAYPKAKDHGQSIAGVGVGQWRASQQKAAPHDRFRVLRWVKGGNPSTHKELFCDGHHIAGAAAALTSKLPHEH